jgi:uncharacterized glyoxalase superfamily protein PhnB
MKTASTMAAAMAVACLTVGAGDSVSSNSNGILVRANRNYETFQAKVVKVFAAEDNEAKFRAYQVKWKGFDVVVSDTFAATDTKEGDLLTFNVRRRDAGKGRLLFLSFQAEGAVPVIHIPYRRTPALGSLNEATTSAKGNFEIFQVKVVKVFTAEDNGVKFRAYEVKWKGFDVVISDTMGDVDAQEGESLTFMVIRSSGMAPPTLHFTARNYRAK